MEPKPSPLGQGQEVFAAHQIDGTSFGKSTTKKTRNSLNAAAAARVE
jgi:hypothetical protein